MAEEDKKPNLREFQFSLIITEKKPIIRPKLIKFSPIIMKKKNLHEIHLFGKRIRTPAVWNKKEKDLDKSVIPMAVPEALKAAVAEKGGSSELVLVAFKVLTESDVKRDQNRLYVPKTKQLMEYLRGLQESTDVYKGIKLGVVDASGRLYGDMKFKIWRSVDQPVLETQWNKLVEDNDLKKDDRVHVYAFRFADGKLGFALNIGRQEVV